jgi:hypothetical protein
MSDILDQLYSFLWESHHEDEVHDTDATSWVSQGGLTEGSRAEFSIAETAFLDPLVRILLRLHCQLLTSQTAHRDDFKPPEHSNFIPAGDIYSDSQLQSLLRTREPGYGIYWHILPPTHSLKWKKYRQRYNIISPKYLHSDEDFLEVSIDKLVALFPCSRNVESGLPDWVQSLISTVARTRAPAYSVDVRRRFYYAIKSIQMKQLKARKKKTSIDTSSISTRSCKFSVCIRNTSAHSILVTKVMRRSDRN